MGAGLLEEYRAEVERIFGNDLVSLTVYGSHADAAPEPGHDVSAFIVVGVLRREALAACRDVARRFARKGIPPPPIFTEEFLAMSADVFPIEFLEMAERRRVLAGRDVLEGLKVSTANLRHQVEFELKGKLLSLMRMYMRTLRPGEVAELVRETVGPLVAVARGLLLLGDRRAPHHKEEIIDALEERFDVRLPALRAALAARKGSRSETFRADEAFFGYLDDVRTLCGIADRFPGDGPGADAAGA